MAAVTTTASLAGKSPTTGYGRPQDSSSKHNDRDKPKKIYHRLSEMQQAAVAGSSPSATDSGGSFSGGRQSKIGDALRRVSSGFGSESPDMSPARRVSNMRRGSFSLVIESIRHAEELDSSVISPESWRYQAWVAWVTFCLLYHSVCVPLRCAFDPPYTPAWIAFDALIALTYIGDILVESRTVRVTEHGELIKDPPDIRGRYLRTWFAVDLLAVPPIPGAWRALTLVKTVRVLRARTLVRQIGQHHGLNILRIMNYFVAMILVSHWLACGWVGLLSHDSKAEERDDYYPDDDAETYVAALYLSLCMLVGSDIRPLSFNQRLYCSFTLLVGACFLAVIVGNMALLVANFNLQQTRHRQKMDLLTDTMRAYRLPPLQCGRIRSYYEYLATHNRDLDGIHLLRELPPAMFAELAQDLHRDMLLKVPLFQDCEEGFIAAISVKLYPQVYLAGQAIVRRGDVGRDMYFIAQGSVQVLDANERTVAVLHDGSFFGEIALLANMKRVSTVKAITNVDVHGLNADDMLDVLQDFPGEAEKFRKEAVARITQQGTKHLSANDKNKLEKLRRLSTDGVMESLREEEAVVGGRSVSEMRRHSVAGPSTMPGGAMGGMGRGTAPAVTGPPAPTRRMSRGRNDLADAIESSSELPRARANSLGAESQDSMESAQARDFQRQQGGGDGGGGAELREDVKQLKKSVADVTKEVSRLAGMLTDMHGTVVGTRRQLSDGAPGPVALPNSVLSDAELLENITPAARVEWKVTPEPAPEDAGQPPAI